MRKGSCRPLRPQPARQSLPGIRVFLAQDDAAPIEVRPPPGPSKYWSRRALAEWLIEELGRGVPTLVGLDHAFSFPLRCFDKYRLDRDWTSFLDDFQRHWPTDKKHIYVDFVREGLNGDGAARQGDSRWRRLTGERAGGAKSVFHFGVPGSVAKATHAGLPWLRTLRQRLGGKVHFWPFDGWSIPAGRSAIVEVYPSLWSKRFSADARNRHQHDAYSVAAWMAKEDRSGRLGGYLDPDLSELERSLRSSRDGFWACSEASGGTGFSQDDSDGAKVAALATFDARLADAARAKGVVVGCPPKPQQEAAQLRSPNLRRARPQSRCAFPVTLLEQIKIAAR